MGIAPAVNWLWGEEILTLNFPRGSVEKVASLSQNTDLFTRSGIEYLTVKKRGNKIRAYYYRRYTGILVSQSLYFFSSSIEMHDGKMVFFGKMKLPAMYKIMFCIVATVGFVVVVSGVVRLIVLTPSMIQSQADDLHLLNASIVTGASMLFLCILTGIHFAIKAVATPMKLRLKEVLSNRFEFP